MPDIDLFGGYLVIQSRFPQKFETAPDLRGLEVTWGSDCLDTHLARSIDRILSADSSSFESAAAQRQVLFLDVALASAAVGSQELEVQNFDDHFCGEVFWLNSIEFIKKELEGRKIELSAQKYLDKFYKDLDFYSEGEDYLEDGIPHQRMFYILIRND